MNTNQHYVSQVLLRRFTANKRLQKFDVQLGGWRRGGITPPYIFSSLGYNQLIAFGQIDNTLDQEFQKLETRLPKTLAALDGAMTRTSTELPVEIYENLCWYLSFLWNMCPFAKAVAPVNFIHQIMLDLQHGQIQRLQELGHPQPHIEAMQAFHRLGHKFIITGNNYLQIVYRIVFRDKCRETYSMFRHITEWKVYDSPIELPIADIAIVKFFVKDENVMLYILPIGPRKVLVGRSKMGSDLATSKNTIIKSGKLSDTEAEYILDIICASAIFAIASHSKFGDVGHFRRRAISKGITFPKIHRLHDVLQAGLLPFESERDFLITPVNVEEYVKYTHSFITPN